MDKQFNPSPMSEQYIEIAFCQFFFLTREAWNEKQNIKEIDIQNQLFFPKQGK